jgi:hypothetical protein
MKLQRLPKHEQTISASGKKVVTIDWIIYFDLLAQQLTENDYVFPAIALSMFTDAKTAGTIIGKTALMIANPHLIDNLASLVDNDSISTQSEFLAREMILAARSKSVTSL